MKKDLVLNEIDCQLIDLALREDLGHPFADLTIQTLLDPFKENSHPEIHGKVFSKDENKMVVCGGVLARQIFTQINPLLTLEFAKEDGAILAKGETWFNIRGPAAGLLMGERSVLNFLQRLCAISTLTKEFVDRVASTPMRVLDTRKTTPGMRHLEKYAVSCGGGVNHRMGLYDAIMIKNNHIDILGGMKNTIQKLPLKKQGDHPVIVEVRTLEELNPVLELAKGKVNRVLFDNMKHDDLRKGVKMCQGFFETEASGGIHLDNIRALAETGVGFASVGCITHSAKSVDLSMHIET